MDAINAASQPIQTGGGSVNCSKEIRSWERFYIGIHLPSSLPLPLLPSPSPSPAHWPICTEAIKPVVALKSLACKLYLRVDCCGSNTAAEGSRRVVSGQHYLGAWEKFILGIPLFLLVPLHFALRPLFPPSHPPSSTPFPSPCMEVTLTIILLVRADDGTVSLKSEAFKTFYLSVHIHPQGEDTGGQQQQQHHPSPPPPQHQHATVTVSEELQSKFLMRMSLPISLFSSPLIVAPIFYHYLRPLFFSFTHHPSFLFPSLIEHTDFQPSGSVVFENVDVVKDRHLHPPSSPSSPPSSPPPPSPSPSPPPRSTRPLYLSMAANGTVSCSPPPICNNHCFVIVVDT